MKSQQIICILGMHRSGTSLVSRILNILGVYLGPEAHIMQPGPDNPKGYWEHYMLTALNDEILARLGGSWHEVPVFPAGWEVSSELADLRQRARAILQEDFATADLWGWKDPRTCLTLPFWQRLLPPMRYVICLRNPVDVSRSLERRDNFPFEKGVQLWLAHVTSALRHTTGQPRLFVFYEDLMEDWPTEIKRLANFLGKPELAEEEAIRSAIQEFIEEELQHHRTSLVDAIDEPKFSFPAKALYIVLRAYAMQQKLDFQPAIDLFSSYAVEAAAKQEQLSRLVALLQEQVRERDQAITQLEQERLNMERHLQAQLGEREQRIEQLEGQIAQLKAEQERLTQELAEKERAVHDLSAQLAKREEAVRQLEELLAQIQAEQQAEREASEAKLQTLAAEQERLTQQLVEKEQQASILQSQIASLQQRLSWKRYRIVDRLLGYYWYLWHPKQTWQRAQVRALERRRLPKNHIISAVSNKRSLEYPRQEVQDDLLKAGLVFNVDSLRFNKNRIYGWGWLFHKTHSIKSLRLLIRVKNSTYEVPCRYGLPREDVASQYHVVNAKYSGFFISGKLPVQSIPQQFFLEIDFTHGDIYRLEIFPTFKGTYAQAPGKVPRIKRWGRATLKYFAQGDFKGWLGAVRRKIREVATQFGPHPIAFDPDQILSIAGRDTPHRFSLIIDHNLGGGANLYRQRLIQEKKQSAPLLLMLYDLPTLEYHLHYLYRDDERVFLVESLDSLTELCKKVQIEEIFLNNLVSFDEPLLVAQWCLQLKRLTGARLTILVHDYFCICPSYTLLDDEGHFCGVPALSRCRECLRNHKGSEFLALVGYRDIDTWRVIWGELLQAADSILCFSRSSVDILQRAYPELDMAKITVQPHRVEPLRKVQVPLSSPLHVGIVGNIYGEAKGTGIVKEMVRIIEEEQLPIKVTLIGTIENPPLSPVLRITGQYQREGLPAVIERSGANVFFLPSICSETFSYVTQELIQMGVPVAVFDLGAQAEHVRTYPLGLVISKIDPAYALKALIDFHRQLCKSSRNITQPLVQSQPGDSQREQNPSIHVCTCVAVNYLPKARLMCSSLKRYHPEFKVHLVLVDKVPEWFDLKSEPFDSLITLEQLGIPNLKSWIFRYSVLEMCTGVKPFALRTLLNMPDCEGVFFFDPDIVFFSRLDDLVQELRQNSILLIPHQTKPEHTHEAIMDNEICSLKHGIFNLGFIGIRNDEQGKAFLDWWADRVERFCWAELEQGVWTDQKWVNFAPVFFEGVKIIKSSRFDVAPWNVTTRKLQGSVEEGITVDGEPLGFYHFTGFDSGAHEIMAMKYAGDNKALRSLIRWYKTAIQEDKRAAGTPWGYASYTTFENGEPITPAHRIIYKRRRDLQEAYPDPFAVVEDGQCYYNWFRWRAAVEHPEIVGSQSERISQVSDRSKLVSNWYRIWKHLKRSLVNPSYSIYLWKVMRSILKTEGWRGLKKRLFYEP
jgi:hypothetical protein